MVGRQLKRAIGEAVGSENQVSCNSLRAAVAGDDRYICQANLRRDFGSGWRTTGNLEWITDDFEETS